MQAECQSRGFSIKVLFIPQLREIYISRILLFLCPTKDFFRNLYLRFSTKIFYLYELVIKWRAGQKEKRSRRRRGREVLVFRCLRNMTRHLRIWFLRGLL